MSDQAPPVRVTGFALRRARAALAVCLLPALLHAAPITVNSTLDATDANPGDGVCETAPGNGLCTLRAAIQEFNAMTGDGISLPAGTYTLTIAGPGEDAAATGDLDILRPVEITGADRATTIVDGGGLDQVFDVMAYPTTFRGLTVRNGVAGIVGSFANDALELDDVLVTQNQTAGVSSGCCSILVVTDSEISENGGAGILSGPVNLLVTGSRIHGNRNRGIVSLSESVVVSETSVVDNTTDGDGAGIFAIGHPLSVDRSTVARNHAGGAGGGIAQSTSLFTREPGPGAYMSAPSALLTVTDSTVTDNDAGGDGGGILASFGLVLTRSTVSGNQAESGGGVWASSGVAPDLRVVESTVARNVARQDGGGIFKDVAGPGSWIVDSTIALNTAGRDGGGVYVGSGPLPLRSVTVTGNVADSDRDGTGDGGGIFTAFAPDPPRLANTILAANGDTGGEAPDCGGTIACEGYDLIGNATGCTVGGDTTGNVTTSASGLGPLQDNGGPTETVALLPASPAINAGNPAGCTDAEGAALATDQRGLARVQGTACDIGAFESGCGNGVLEDGEACDDGNRRDGDCCSSLCRLEAVGTPCDDGNPCTTSDTCNAGTCVGGPPLTCDPCKVCDPAGGCAVPADAGCSAALPGDAAVVVKNRARDARDVLSFRWNAPGPLTLADVGHPLSGTTYTLCLIDFRSGSPTLLVSASTPADGLCGSAPCWAPDRRGYRYTDQGLGADGLLRILLRPSLDERGHIVLRDKGEALALPAFPLVTPVTLRVLRNDAPACWEAQFAAPSQSSAKVFRARAD